MSAALLAVALPLALGQVHSAQAAPHASVHAASAAPSGAAHPSAAVSQASHPGASHGSGPVSSSRGGSWRASGGTVATSASRPNRGDHHDHDGWHHRHHHRGPPPGWSGPWVAPGYYGYEDGSDESGESWDTPVDANNNWDQSDQSVPPEAAPPDDAQQPEAAPPPAPAAPPDGCSESQDTAVEDGATPSIYQWTDADGVLHFSDYDLIPPEARASAVATSGEPIVVTHKHLKCGPAPQDSEAPQQPDSNSANR